MYPSEWDRSEAELQEPDDDVLDDCSDAEYEQYEQAEAAYDSACAELREALQRIRREVAERMAKDCASGKLQTFARLKEGGALKRLKFHIWNVDDIMIRFYKCDISLEHKFSSSAAANTHWIFIGRGDSFEAMLGETRNKSAVSIVGGQPHRSIFLKFMLQISDEMQISPEHQPLKKTIEELIDKKWTGEYLGKNKRGMMATFIREPESQMGKTKKKK